MADTTVAITQGSGTPIRVLSQLGAGSGDQQVVTLADSAGNLLGTSAAPIPITTGPVGDVALLLSGTSVVYGLNMTVSLGALAATAAGPLPDFGYVDVYIINDTNTPTGGTPQLLFTGDASVAGGAQVPSIPGYQPYLGSIAAASNGVQHIALNSGYLRNVSVVVPFATAATAGTLRVLALFRGNQGVYLVDPTNAAALRIYTENTNFSDNNPNLLVMGREYGGGGGNSFTHALHVDPDGALFRASARVVSSVTAAAGVAVTATLPVPAAGYWNHVTAIHVTKYAAAALTGSATPVLVTSTGLPGTPQLAFGTAAAIGTVEEKIIVLVTPIRATAAALAVSVICPATPSVIWQVQLTGYVA